MRPYLSIYLMCLKNTYNAIFKQLFKYINIVSNFIYIKHKKEKEDTTESIYFQTQKMLFWVNCSNCGFPQLFVFIPGLILRILESLLNRNNKQLMLK